MATLCYCPEIEVHVATTWSGLIDISEDLVTWQLTLRENAPHSFTFTLQNTQRKYDGKIFPMDRISIRLKRLNWLQVFTGLLNDGPIFQAWPGTLDMTATCTLKRPQFWLWDPTTDKAVDMLMGWVNDSNAVGAALGDFNMKKLITTALSEVCLWDPQRIHIGEIPSEWFKWAQPVVDAVQADEALYKAIGKDFTAAGQDGAGVSVVLPAQQYGNSTLNDVQAKNASKIYAACIVAGASDVIITMAFMCALTESSLRVLANSKVPGSEALPHEDMGGDGLSVGLFQMQVGPSYNWGTVAQCQDPTTATKIFLDHFKSQTTSISTSGYGYAIQQVWGSGTPDGSNYQKNLGVAQALLAMAKKVSKSLGSTVASTGGNTMVGGSTGSAIGLPTGVQDSTGTSIAALAMQLIQDHTPPAGAYIKYVLNAGGQDADKLPVGDVKELDCLAAGTLVATDKGDVPIEAVRAGDRVLTRAGYRSVLRAWKVREEADIVQVVVNGRILRGTADHRVWTANRGWVGLGSLDSYDTLVSCLSLQPPLSVRSSTDTLTTDTLIHQTGANELTFRVGPTLTTERSGVKPTGRFQLGTRSIMLTTIPSTTPCPTSTWCRSQSIDEKVRPTANSMNTFVPNAAQPSRRMPPPEVHVGSVANNTARTITIASIGNVPRKSSPLVSFMSLSVPNAAQSFRRLSLIDEVLDGSVANSTKWTITTASSASASRNAGRADVYDLMIEGDHEFFADGVLVHNCSSLVTWVYFHGTGRQLPHNSDKIAAACGSARKIDVKQAANVQGAVLVIPGDHIAISVGDGTNHVAAHTEQNTPPHQVDVSPIATGGGFSTAYLLPNVDYSQSATTAAAVNELKRVGVKKPVLGTQIGGDPASVLAGDVTPQSSTWLNLLNWIQLGALDKTGTTLGGTVALINDEPFLPWLQTLINGTMRSFCSAPNGDFIAWFPDYFGAWKSAGAVDVELIELQDFTVKWSDQNIITHQFVIGNAGFSILDQTTGAIGSNVNNTSAATALLSLAQQMTGVASFDYPEIFKLIYGEIAPKGFIEAFLERFGARKDVQQVMYISHYHVEFFYALYLFIQRWAAQFTANVPMTFMPELFPGMLLRVPAYGFQAYVQQVVHSGSYGEGGSFTTSVSICAPSNTGSSSRTDLLSLLPLGTGSAPVKKTAPVKKK